MVSDFYDNTIPWIEPYSPFQPTKTNPFPLVPPVQVEEKPEQDIVKTLREFAEAMMAAKKVDELTGQPDCVDPEKAKLEDRVKELEALIESGCEFVLWKRQNMQPGKYKIIDGKLHKVIE